jgi:hypothetical protein
MGHQLKAGQKAAKRILLENYISKDYNIKVTLERKNLAFPLTDNFLPVANSEKKYHSGLGP